MNAMAEIVHGSLAASGFTNIGSGFACRNDSVAWFASLQSATHDEASMTVNLGVYIPGLLNSYLKVDESNEISIPLCAVSARLGMLDSSSLDKWWDVDSLRENPAEAEDLGSRLETQALPFFQRFPTIHAVANFLIAPRERKDRYVDPRSDVISQLYGGLALFESGDQAKAREVLNEVAASSASTPLSEVIPAFIRTLPWMHCK